MPRLLLISYRFPPESYPLAIGLHGVLDELRADWDINVITAADPAYSPSGVTVHHVPPVTINPLLRALNAARLNKLGRLISWPDPFWPWIWPAYRKAASLVDARRPDVALVFMMPFSTGFVGTLLKHRTGLPVVLNLNDSPTCSDMSPTFPSALHYRLSVWMENRFVETADHTVYVSAHNRNRIRAQCSTAKKSDVRLVRCSAAPPAVEAVSSSPTAPDDKPFRIVYTGAMSAWHSLDPGSNIPSVAKRAYRAWDQFGTFVHAPLDVSTHSPVYIGKAILRVLNANPDWAGRIHFDIYGNTFPDPVVERVLQSHGLTGVVNIHGRIPHDDVMSHIRASDLLFLTLPDRLDGSPGGRISLKTYEYLMTDRPILAAVPPGENWDFLRDQPGAFLTAPKDVAAMAEVIEGLAAITFSGRRSSFKRPGLRKTLSSSARANALSAILREAAGLPATVDA